MIILITGGASGLGGAITKMLAAQPQYTVYFTYSNSAEKAEALERKFSNVSGIKCNFNEPTEIEWLKSRIAELQIDVLINNAYSGNPVKTYFQKIPERDFAEEFRLNVLPTIGITQAAIQVFRKKKQGKIITVLTSFLLNNPPMGTASYVAAKAYLAALVKCWAAENSKFNIASNSVSPSFMQTALTADVDERLIEQMVESHPLKKLLTVEEVAQTVLFLVGSSAQLNGMDIVLNAGANLK